MTEVTIQSFLLLCLAYRRIQISSSFKLSKAGASDKPALAVVVAAGIKKSMLKQAESIMN